MSGTDAMTISADAYCRSLTAGHYENFAVASGFVSRLLRDDLARFYAFCRTTDDLGDESGSPERALARLAMWREQTQALFAGEPALHPVLIALGQTIERHQISPQPFLDLIAANEQDQRVHRYESWPQLRAYCMLSAAPVGRVVLQLFGIGGVLAQQLSDDVCIGLQLANHAQDVQRDALIGRRYLLDEDVAAHGTRGAVREMVLRARALLRSGKALEPLAPGVLRLQLALYRLGGAAICDAIAGIGYRTDIQRPVVTKARKLALLAQAAFALTQSARGARDAQPA